MADDQNKAPEDLGASISYLVLAEGTPVYDRAGDRVGRVDHVLADDREDIFHGLVLKTAQGHRYASGDLVDGLFEHGAIVAVPAEQLPEPSADPAAQAVQDKHLINELKRAWKWIVRPK
jgi:hypothetical protein